MKKTLAFGFLVLLPRIANAQTVSPTVIQSAEYKLTASAYMDSSNLHGTKNKPTSRFDLQLESKAKASHQWDFSLSEIPGSSFTYIKSALGSSNSKVLKKTTIKVVLHNFEIYEEKVTFKDLNLTTANSFPFTTGSVSDGPRFLSLPEERSLTTPSGIKVTLPAQVGPQQEDFNEVMNGNTDALWVRIKVTPSTKISNLPKSPLTLKYKLPVSIKLKVASPNFLVSYAADNSYTGVKVGLPNLKNVKRLDELTFIVQQRIDLQTVPLSIEVPISKSVAPKTQKISTKVLKAQP
ncbi:MAG: hypothetical protein EOP04_13795 [Proteobacteria bacterium]|nr:MAG: hypothetical protein EOP04_13795 [Pseudomonadota bacterium]